MEQPAGTAAGPSSSKNQPLPRSTFMQSLTFRRDSKVEGGQTESPRGPLGLTNLYAPKEDAVADLIFVHGLNGGSYSTWTHGEDSSKFWPKLWLSNDVAFKDVRISTFGYSSGVDKESVLNIADFSRLLLSAIHDSPTIPREKAVSSDPCLSLTRNKTTSNLSRCR